MYNDRVLYKLALSILGIISNSYLSVQYFLKTKILVPIFDYFFNKELVSNVKFYFFLPKAGVSAPNVVLHEAS